jgi:hypothetical protein
MTPFNLLGDYQRSEEHAAFIFFYPEDGEIFLRNTGNHGPNSTIL